MSKPNSMIFYRGPSMLDGSPIVAVISGLARGTINAKTGAILQTYILADTVDPIAAVRSGADASICGDCPRRSPTGFAGRSCYVNVAQGPLAIYRALSGMPLRTSGVDRVLLGSGRTIRLGTYGDPAAVPVAVWRSLLRLADSWVGYTHQWRNFPALKPYCMASADSEADAKEAQAEGWRTFRVRSAADSLLKAEVICPASAEAGKRLTCAECGACGGGDRRGSIAIIAHGSTPAMRAA